MSRVNALSLAVHRFARVVPPSLVVLCVALAGCGGQGDGGGATATTTPISHDFPELTVDSGQEILGLCRSWTMNNDEELWVSSVELTQDEESHHSNWVFVPEGSFPGEDGVWTCADRGYDIYSAMDVGGLLYAQSTQATHEVQTFPNGAAVRVPPRSKIISDIHLLNTTSAAVTGHAKLTAYTIPADAVKVKLQSFHMEYDDLHIPAHSSERFTAVCAVGADVAAATGEPFDMKVYYLLPHTHTLATRFFAEVLGGPRDGESILDIGAYNGETHGEAFATPIDMSGSKGFTFGCEYSNPRSTDAVWGFGSDEMCELFGFADNPAYFQSRVNKGTADGIEGEVNLFTGPCETDAYKPGASSDPGSL